MSQSTLDLIFGKKEKDAMILYTMDDDDYRQYKDAYIEAAKNIDNKILMVKSSINGTEIEQRVSQFLGITKSPSVLIFQPSKKFKKFLLTSD